MVNTVHIRTHKYIEIPFRKREGEDIYIHMGSSGTYDGFIQKKLF